MNVKESQRRVIVTLFKEFKRGNEFALKKGGKGQQTAH